MRAHFSTVDVVVLVAYFAVTLAVGFWRRRGSTEDYLIADRGLGLPVFVATLVATWYGGILAVGEFTYRWGIVNWSTQGLPYYIFAILFALFLARRVRHATLYTIPDKLSREYDRRTALLGAAFAFFMITPAPYVLMVGQLVHVMFGWPMAISLVVGLLFSVAYVYVGGFQSDVRINVLQFILMFAGFALALALLAGRWGGPGWLAAHVPPDHLKLDGGLGAGYVIVWAFIALWTLVDPGFHQRCYAAKSPTVARNGILAAVVCFAVFDFLTSGVGLYAKAILPNLSDEGARLAFPLIAERALPSGVKGFFYVAMLATIMSTVVSYTFIGAMTVGRDFVWRLRGERGNESVPRYTRWGLIVTSVVSVAVALAIPSVVTQWWAIGTVFVPGMLFAVLAGYSRRWKVAPAFAFAGMLLASLTAAACLGAGWARAGDLATAVADSSRFPFGQQPMYPGLVVGAAIYVLGLLMRPLVPPTAHAPEAVDAPAT